jgi:hypothetical protein
MKNLLLPILGVLFFASCNHKPSGNHNPSPGGKVMDIITVTDNGITYADTIMHSIPSGKIMADNPEISTEGTGTGRFAPRFRNQAIIVGDSMECSISKTANNATLALVCEEKSSRFPIYMQIAAKGPTSGIGVFEAKGIETSQSGVADTMATFTELFKGGQQYMVDSVVVNITQASGNQVSGNYKLWVTNTAGSKTVTGTIDCNAAWIDSAMAH